MRIRRIIAAGVAMATAVATFTVIEPSTASALPEPGEEELAAQLAAAATKLKQASMLADLLPVVPGLEANPAMLLGFHEVIGTLESLSTITDDLGSELDALEATVDGLEFDGYDIDDVGGLRQATFTMSLNRTVEVPLTIIDGDVQILGEPVAIQVELAPTTITMEVDPADPAATFALTSLPTFAFTASIDSTQNVPIRFGFADATASGDFDIGLAVNLSLVDPDGTDRLDAAELSTLAIEDLTQLDFPNDDGVDDLSIDLALTADVFGTAFGGELTISDEHFFSGDDPVIEFDAVGANPIDLLSNISADTAITSLAQLVSGFGATMLAGDVELPFLADGVFIPSDLGSADLADFDRVFEAIQPLMDYVVPRSTGQIVCGTGVGPDPDGVDGPEDGLPTGALVELGPNQPVFCRTFTAVDGSAQWSVNGVDVGGAGTTIGTDPTTNIELSANGSGQFSVAVAFTPDDGSGLQEILPRPETIQDLLVELADAGLIPLDGADPDFDYDADTQSFRFPFEFTAATGGPDDPVIEREATINAGNSLVADTGITGLSAAASASANYSLSDISAGVTLGLIVAEDITTINPDDNGTSPPGPLDRFFVSGVDSILEVGDVEVGGDLDMVGRLGFLEIAAELSGTLGKPDADAPAVSVGLAGGPGVEVGGTAIPDAVLIRDLLSDGLVDLVDADVNLEFDGAASVTADAAGLGASGGFDILWNLDDPAPTIENVTTEFTNTLLPFGGDLSLTQSGPADPTDPTLLTVASGSVNLLATPGLVGSQLVDDDGNVCNITAVLSATQLNCSNPDGDVLNPITFTAGDSYEVKGNTLSGLADILAALDALVLYLEEAVGTDAFDTQIDLIGVSPSDIVGQIDELRRMIDEFRGVQDAYIDCRVQGAPDDDVRAIPLAVAEPPAVTPDVTLECAAEATTTNPTDVRWRVVPADGDPGAFVAGDSSTVSGAPDLDAANQTLTVPSAFDTDGDGFVSLGDEYGIEIEWSDATGDHQAAFPPRVPQSLSQLERLINDTLGLPDGVLQFTLENAPADPTLRITMAYGICSEGNSDEDCENMPTGPRPEANLTFDVGSTDLVGLDVTGELTVDYAAIGTFDVGVPLDGSEPVLYGDTGLDARLQVAGSDDLSLTASIGPISAILGSDAVGASGSAEAGSESGTLVSTGAFTAASTGMVITRTSGSGGECVITTVSDDEVGCDLDWAVDDAFQLGGRNDVSAGLTLEVQVRDAADLVLGPDEFVAFGDAGVEVTPLAEILGGGECGPIDEDLMDQVVGSGVSGDERDLSGLGCAQLSLMADLAGSTTYLGELDVELIAGPDPLRVWVPSSLAADLADAALDPAFLLRLLPGLLASIEEGMRSAADSGIPAAVGDPLRTGADGIETLREGVEAAIDGFAGELVDKDLGGELEGTIAAELADLLGLEPGDITVVTWCDDASTVACASTDTLSDVRDISATFTFGDLVEATAGVNLGLEGLPLSVQGGVDAFAEWGLTLGLGVSTSDGPYIALDGAAPEFLVSAGVTIASGPTDCAAPLAAVEDEYTTDRCLQARLGFLQVEALDNTKGAGETGSVIGAHLGLNVTVDGDETTDRITLADLVGGDVDVTPEIAAGIDLDLHIRTGIAGATADLPSISGTFALGWNVGTFALEADDATFVALTGITVDTPTVAFENLHLDLGEVIEKFMEPVTQEIKKITGPMQPIIDVLTAPIPVVSDLAELVGEPPITMISVLEGATGADLSLVKAVAAFVTFVNNIPDGGSLSEIPLGPIIGGGTEREPGAFTVDAAKAATSVSPSEAGALIDQSGAAAVPFTGGTGFTHDVGEAGGGALNNASSPDPGRPSTFGVPGLSFPFLEDASQIFGILVGRDATLIRWDAGTLKASAGMSYDFGPIMVGPVPITITIGGEIGVEGRFAIGYDTSGIRKLLDGGSGVALFDGIFIDDLDAQGNDVPEIVFKGRVFAGASVDLVIVSAGVRGGIELTFTLDLDDRPDPDGKLRIEEIVDKLANPICLFVVGGKIEAFLEVFVKIDLFLFSKEFGFELVRVTLLEWSSACEPPAPKPAEQDEDTGVLYLNIGDRADRRNIQEDVTDESIEVRQLGPGKVRVSAFGFEQVFTGVTLIVADGGSDDDEIKLLPGTDDELDESSNDLATEVQPFDIPAVISGGPGADIVKTGDGADLILGDAPVSGGTWEGVAYSGIEPQAGDHGDDSINAGGGDDVVKSDGGADQVEGEAGRDTLEGGDGNDTLNGGPGGDAVLGQGGDDTVHGGPIPQPAADATDADIDDDDALSGGTGVDTVSGDFGSDVAFGDDAVAGFFDPDAAMRRIGYSKPDLSTWRGWCSSIGGAEGAADADIVVGNAGNDFLLGGSGDDQIDGDEGDDRACGNGGRDLVVGDVGDDELRGDEHDDTLRGDDGHDLIHGGSGNDTANGNAGADDIFGDAGSDLLFGDEGDDVVVGDTGSIAAGHGPTDHGVDDGFGDVSVARVQAISAAVTRDSSTSGPARESCDPDGALGDSDCIFGGSGSDALFGGSDGDLVQGQAGVDLIEGNHGPDDLRGGTDRDLLFGNEDGDLLFGDGDDDEMYGDRAIPNWVVDDPAGAAVDEMYGGPGMDHMEGDGAGDRMFGGAHDDHMEGNDGDDEMRGETGDDDMIGGSDLAGEPDIGETFMSGGPGSDVMTGDNAIIGSAGIGGNVGGRSVELLDLPIGGADTMYGDAGTDYMFGQIGGDEMHGGDDGDYMEGDDGDDTMFGDAGDDDMVGGGSADDGLIDDDRDGTGLPDVGETLMHGGAGLDWMTGDNARLNRVLHGGSGGAAALIADPIQLFDLGTVDAAAAGGSFGGDTMHGGDQTDFMFGQGGDDVMHGDTDDDYLEGNDGVDAMFGDAGDDDMVGGGSANDGLILPDRIGDGLLDQGEQVMHGGDGIDWMVGDNAFMNRVLFDDTTTPIDLFDVNTPPDVEAQVSGGDTMSGDAGADLMFGQGNGAQSDQSDPPDGNDNDGDGATDEDVPWLGDTMSGGDGDDYLEGNDGSDLIGGDAGDDDLIGGGSAFDGLFVPGRIGNGLFDERDTVHGGSGQDVITGDNARINHAADAINSLTGLLQGTDREVVLFDVDSTDPSLSGGDYLAGGTERDLVFGQGNGAQDPAQADPLDGVDNDFDGREGPDSTEYDCADNGFDNDGDSLADDADPGCDAAVDEDRPWDGDIVFGNEGDDYLEGNHGADWMFGGADEDDMIGGGSANDGIVDPDRDPVGLLDGPDVMHGEDEDDVMTGDNARINRVIVDGGFARIGSSAGVPDFGPYDQAIRITDMVDGDDGPGTSGDDYVTGGAGNDEMYGQLGDDFLLGNAGDDGIVGDLGQVRANVLGDGVGIDPAQQAIATNSPHWDDVVFETGSLLYETELYAFDTSAGGVGGDDVILGYDGRDTAFGGPGADIIQGDGDATEEFFDAEQPEFTHMVDVDPSTADRDQLFGGDDGDAIWGGRDNDILMGGHGDDHLDVRPREETDNGRNGANFRLIPRDPPSWFTWAFPENFQDVDFIYGGWDRDALQADQAANGPDPGDRLADWAGGFNVEYLCPAGYGDHTITRMGSPHAREFLRALTSASGAYLTSTEGASGFRDLGYVFPNERGANSHPPHPDHPGHFTCADYSQVGSAALSADAGGPYELAEGGTASLDGTGSSGVAGFGWETAPFAVDAATSPTPTISAAGLDDSVAQVSVEVTDGNGSYDTATADVTVVNVPPTVTASAPTVALVGDDVGLSASFTDPGVLDTHTMSIDWGDGDDCDPSPDSGCTLTQLADGGEVGGTHAFATAGTYEVTVTVTDDDGGVGVSPPIVVVVSAAPAQTVESWTTVDPWPVSDPVQVGGTSYTRADAIALFDDGRNNEQSPFLFRELVAALLNGAAGADTSCVTSAIAGADAWLVANPPGSGVKKNAAAWTDDGRALYEQLAAYNAGGSCAPPPG